MRLQKSYKNDWTVFASVFKQRKSSQKTAYYAQVEAQAVTKKETQTNVITLWNFKNWLKMAGIMKLLQLTISSLRNFSVTDQQNTRKTLLKSRMSNKLLILFELSLYFLHWLNLLMLKILRMKKTVLLISQGKVLK